MRCYSCDAIEATYFDPNTSPPRYYCEKCATAIEEAIKDFTRDTEEEEDHSWELPHNQE